MSNKFIIFWYSKLFIYYTNLNSLIICCLFSVGIYLFLYIYIFSSFSSVFKTFCDDFFETLVISSAILLTIKSPVASAVFLIALFEAVFITYVVDFIALSRGFRLNLFFKFLLIFLANGQSP